MYQSSLEWLDDAIDEPALLLNYANQAVFALDVNMVSTAGNSIQKVQRLICMEP